LGFIDTFPALLDLPGDAFHAAHALDSGCPVIVSSYPDFDRFAAIRRVGRGS
jgi:predicted nucleic acid-binding protein